jgi:L-ascorbate metabolism protein UlaG (beta-lactamase superfamily)
MGEIVRSFPVRLLRAVAVFLAGLLLATALVLAGIWQWRPGLEAYAARAYTAQPAAGALTARWLGVTAVLLSDGTHAVLVDPFFTRPRGFWRLALNRPIAPDEALIKDWLARAGVTKLDAVLVSHSHYDHAMDAGVVARLTGATLMGSASTLNIGRGAGLPESRLQTLAFGPVSFGPFQVTFVESRHAGATGGAPTGEIMQPLVPPARFLDYKQGGAYSILIAHPRGRVLHHGSAGYVPGALAGFKADVVFLGVALLPELAPYLAEVVDAVGAHRVMPVHWDDFTQPLDQPLRPFPLVVRLDRFFKNIAEQRPDLAVQTLELNRPVSLFPRAGTP